MNKPHKHAEVIKAWADGKEIQYQDGGFWIDWNWLGPTSSTGHPNWRYGDWRIKPEPKDPGIVCRDAFYRAIYPGHEPKSVHSKEWTAAAKAVIEAYKAGELKDI